MKGHVFAFDRDTNIGVISGFDGGRYDFVRLDWHGPAPPMAGDIVDFIPDGSRATRIFPIGLRGDPAQGGTANAIYILYLIGLVFGITALVGLVMAYVNRGDAPEWLKTHYRFQIRTFWIGFLYIAVSVLTLIALVGFALGLLTIIWIIVRCAKGMQALARGEAYPDPATWLW